MAELLRHAGQELPPIAGVVHSAAVLAPAAVGDLSPSEIDQTLHPKVAGGWVLHRLFADRPLDFFVLFSSAVALLADTSVAHQLSAYAAANAVLDALAEHRRSTGRPATVVDWGYWADTGLAARLSVESGHEVRPAGMMPIHSADAYRLFDDMLRADRRMVHLPADWRAYIAAYPQDADIPTLRGLLCTPSAGDRGARPHPTFETRPSPVTATPKTAPSLAGPTTRPHPDDVADYLVEQVAVVLGTTPAQIDRHRPTDRLGLDSLMAADVRNRLRRDRGLDVTVPRLLGAAGLADLARELAAPTRSTVRP
jgi:polyketide synthase 12